MALAAGSAELVKVLVSGFVGSSAGALALPSVWKVHLTAVALRDSYFRDDAPTEQIAFSALAVVCIRVPYASPRWIQRL